MKTLCLAIFILLSYNCGALQCKALKNAIINEKIQAYLHSELTERKTLYVVKNQFCELNENVGSVKVVTVDSNTAQERKNYLHITSFKEFEKHRELSIDYPLEGAVFNIKLDNNNEVSDVVVIEK